MMRAFFFALGISLVVASPAVAKWWGTEKELPVPAEMAAARDELEAKLRDVYRRDSEMLKDLFIHQPAPGTWTVYVSFRGPDQFIVGLTKRSIENSMLRGYEAIFTSRLRVGNAVIEAYMPVMDKFGYEREETVYSTAMPHRIGTAINWPNKHSLKPSQLWVVTAQHRAFSE